MLSIKEEREQHLADAIISFTKVVNQNWSDREIRRSSNITELCTIFSEMMNSEKHAFKRKVITRMEQLRTDITLLEKEIALHNHITARQTNDVIIANNAFRRGIIERRNILNSIERIRTPVTLKLKKRLTVTDKQLFQAKEVLIKAKAQTSSMKELIESLRSKMDILANSTHMELSNVKRWLISSDAEWWNVLKHQWDAYESRSKNLSTQITVSRKSSQELKHALSDFLTFLDPSHTQADIQPLLVCQYVDNLVKKAKQQILKHQTKSSITSKKKIASLFKEQLNIAVRARESELYRKTAKHQDDLDELQDAISNVMQANTVKRRSVVFDLPEQSDDTWWKENTLGIQQNLQEMNAMRRKYL